MRRRGGPLAMLVVAGALVACGPATPAEVGEGADLVEPGVLTACVAETPRLVVATDDGWEGYDVEALAAVATALDLELRLVDAPFDDLVSGVAVNDAHRCDVAAAGIVAGGDLTTLVDVTAPYRVVDRLVVAPAAASEPDVAVATVGVEDGGPAADAVGGLDAGEVVTAPSLADLSRLLAAGEVDAVLVPNVDVPVLEEALGPVAIVERVPTGDQTVMVLPRGTDEALATAVDEALVAFRDGPDGAAASRRWLDG